MPTERRLGAAHGAVGATVTLLDQRRLYGRTLARCRLFLVAGALGATIALLASAAPPWPGGAVAHVLSPPTGDTELTFFAHGSCADQRKPQPFWETILATKPELFVYYGDIVYGDCFSEGCPELAAAWRSLFAHPSFAAAAGPGGVPMTGVPDDHDYGLRNSWSSNPHKALAKAHFLERFGVPRTDARRGRGGLYTSHTFGPSGRRTQIVLLDTRWFRSPFLPTDCRGCPGRERHVPYNLSEAAAHTMLGEEQWAWLEEQLRSPADLRLVVSTVQVLAAQPPRGRRVAAA